MVMKISLFRYSTFLVYVSCKRKESYATEFPLEDITHLRVLQSHFIWTSCVLWSVYPARASFSWKSYTAMAIVADITLRSPTVPRYTVILRSLVCVSCRSILHTKFCAAILILGGITNLSPTVPLNLPILCYLAYVFFKRILRSKVLHWDADITELVCYSASYVDILRYLNYAFFKRILQSKVLHWDIDIAQLVFYTASWYSYSA